MCLGAIPSTLWAEPLVFEGGSQRLELVAENAEAIFMHGVASVQFGVDAEGAAAMSALTGAMIGETLTISLCGQVLVEAVVRERITGGRSIVNLPNIETATLAATVMTDDRTCADLEAARVE